MDKKHLCDELLEKRKNPYPCNSTGGFMKVEIKQLEVERNSRLEQIANLNRANEKLLDTNDKPTCSAEVEPRYEYLPNLKPGSDGKVDWTPLAEMTGTRPIVTNYSLARYSLPEWNQRTEKVLDTSVIDRANIIDFNCKAAMCEAFGSLDYEQEVNNRRLRHKAKEVFRWKVEVAEALKKIKEELEKLETERQRMKTASSTLMLPESISKECLNLRCLRPANDLVADFFDEELKKEVVVVRENRAAIQNTLEKIEEQLVTIKRAKHRLEMDLSNKQAAYDVDCKNIGLNVKSDQILFIPGATKYPQYSASLEAWQQFCQQAILDSETERQRSVDLRGTINDILIKGGKKLRMQADSTDVALVESIARKQEICTKLEQSLLELIRQIADIETLINNLKDAIRKHDAAMKLAQTRLNNRNEGRSRNESVRDPPEDGLIGEIKIIHAAVTKIRSQLIQAEAVRKEMLDKRLELEKDIASKRQMMLIDRQRCGMIRSHFPSASELAGL